MIMIFANKNKQLIDLKLEIYKMANINVEKMFLMEQWY